MTILGMDTATPVASVALVKDGALILEKRSPPGGSGSVPSLYRANHGETLFPLIQSLFEETRVSWDDLAALAVTNGPGSFTGLRIGLSAAKGLAYGWDIPVIGVSTLLAVAVQAADDWNGWVCPLLDAKREEVYAALFRFENGMASRVLEDRVGAPEDALRTVLSVTRDAPCLFTGVGSNLYADLIRKVFGHTGRTDCDHDRHTVAFAAARIGDARVRSGESAPAGLLAPQYLRSP